MGIVSPRRGTQGANGIDIFIIKRYLQYLKTFLLIIIWCLKSKNGLLKMDTFTDSNTGIKFCVFQNSTTKGNINEYSLINWCEQFVTPNGLFVDIGSNIGAYAIILGKKCKQVFAFEASNTLFACAAVTKCINNAHTVQFENTALGEFEGTAEFYYDNNAFKGSLKKSPKVEGTVTTVGVKRLDSYNLSNIDFLRVDTGGTEFDVIKGASMTLVNNNFPPFIFDKPNDFGALKTFLEGLGYSIHPISGYPTMYLASDNVFREKQEPKKAVEPPKMDLSKLKELYQNGEYDAIGNSKRWNGLSNRYNLGNHGWPWPLPIGVHRIIRMLMTVLIGDWGLIRPHMNNIGSMKRLVSFLFLYQEI